MPDEPKTDPFGRDIDLVSEREDRAIRRLRSLAVRTSLFQTSKTVARKDGMVDTICLENPGVR